MLETDYNVNHGDTPTCSKTPTKPADEQYTYTFAGWSPNPYPANKNETYTPIFESTVKKYTVTWINYDGDELEKDENVPYGTTPEYNRADPTRPDENGKSFTFIGWEPAVGFIHKRSYFGFYLLSL